MIPSSGTLLSGFGIVDICRSLQQKAQAVFDSATRLALGVTEVTAASYCSQARTNGLGFFCESRRFKSQSAGGPWWLLVVWWVDPREPNGKTFGRCRITGPLEPASVRGVRGTGGTGGVSSNGISLRSHCCCWQVCRSVGEAAKHYFWCQYTTRFTIVGEFVGHHVFCYYATTRSTQYVISTYIGFHFELELSSQVVGGSGEGGSPK